ncbi:MAG: acetyl-CoA acetyltransferase [Gordonia sp. (in: high G+C Gram-positive bacteria)]|uniref:acetyl-CoA acetyltransferase n=1 Tax=Gordonia sp. (in: high G+C Gram-positive bacteria) TaxID=84139 RepID=UPI003C761915
MSSSSHSATSTFEELGLNPTTPVIVGVGQAAERLDDPDYAALGEADLAARAVTAALADAGVNQVALAASVDTAVAVRSFENSSPASQSPFGRPDNMPRAVAARVGMEPRRAVVEVTGGQSPQHLVNEFGAEIAAGRAHAVALFGAEVMSTVRHAQRSTDSKPNFAETIGGQLEDRGYGIGGLISIEEVKHGIVMPTAQYSIIENARRHRLGMSGTEYARSMGEWFAPMTRVAAENPFSASTDVHSADDLSTPSEGNRRVSVPYTRRLIARDQVNQSAAVILMSVAAAQAAGIAPDRWVFLHGHADTSAQPLLGRPDISRVPTSVAAVREALRMAGVSLEDVHHLDFYSCFPIAVSHVADELGLKPDDPRGLTVTGGLPYFGGPGNNYSMHAIAEIVQRARRAPGSFGLVGANGGMLSKYSVGLYSTIPTRWRPSTSAGIQAELDREGSVSLARFPNGEATIESFVVMSPDSGRPAATIVGRLADGSRFMSVADSDDTDLLELLSGDADPIGTTVYVRSTPERNFVALSREELDTRHPLPPVGFAQRYEHLEVHCDRQVLEITIRRPESRNALDATTNAELNAVFDAYFADPDLRVAILTGAGDRDFSAGNDLAAGASAAGFSMPANGIAGLTSRREMPKPVIAAVNGDALGSGLEIVLACHIAVADREAMFGLPEVTMGLVSGAGGLVRLPRAISPMLARDMVLTGRRIDAAEALAHGLVSRVAPHGLVLEVARAVAADILTASPVAISSSLESMERTQSQSDVVDAVLDSMTALDTVLVSEDHHEGIAALAQNRQPQWKGR